MNVISFLLYEQMTYLWRANRNAGERESADGDVTQKHTAELPTKDGLFFFVGLTYLINVGKSTCVLLNGDRNGNRWIVINHESIQKANRFAYCTEMIAKLQMYSPPTNHHKYPFFNRNRFRCKSIGLREM